MPSLASGERIACSPTISIALPEPHVREERVSVGEGMFAVYALNAPWLLMPLIILARMWRPADPFAAPDIVSTQPTLPPRGA